VILLPGPAHLRAVGYRDLVEDAREVEALRLPEIDGAVRLQQVAAAHEVSHGPDAQARHDFADFLGHHGEKFTRYSGLPVNIFRNSGSWVATPTGRGWCGTGHHTQPHTTSGAVANPNSSAPSQRGHHHVAPRLHLPVGLHADRAAQPVLDQRLLVSASPSSHGAPACLMDESGEAPCPRRTR